MISPLRIVVTARAELSANRGRSIITAACIAIAVAAFAIIMQLGGSAQRGVDDTVERTQGRAGTVRMTATGAPLPVLLQASLASGEGSVRRQLTSVWGRSLKLADVPLGMDGAAGQPSILGLQAVDPRIIDVLPASVAHGRWLTAADSANLALPVVLGPTVSQEIAQAAGTNPAGLVGRTLTTDRPTLIKMRIVGIVDDGPLVRLLHRGNVAFVPLHPDGPHQALAPYRGASESVDLFALFNASGGNDATVLKAFAHRALVGAGQYSTEITTERIDRADDFAAASRALAILLSVIGAIALLIGVIGVTNVSLMSVRERTREFGLRRALGAGPGVVSALVMTETAMVIMIGGAAGVCTAGVLSWGASTYLTGLLDGVPVEPLTITTAGLGLGASAVCGLLAGLLPAWKAHRATIIQAIRS